MRALLAGGADLHARNGLRADSPTPLMLARALLERDGTHEGAQLVVDAAAPWSPRTHALFPKAARERAVELLLAGELLAREARLAAMLDLWQQRVMPHAVSRESRGLAPCARRAARARRGARAGGWLHDQEAAWTCTHAGASVQLHSGAVHMTTQPTSPQPHHITFRYAAQPC